MNSNTPASAVSPPLPACVVNCALYNADGKLRNLSLDEISDVLATEDGDFVWVGLYEPEEDVLLKLQEEFDLHDLSIEDARKAHQRPKVEAYGPALFLTAHTAQVVDEKIVYGETQAFLGKRYLITVRHGASLSYAAVRTRMEREPELLALGPAMGLYAVLDFIVDQYEPIVQEFRDTLRKLEKDIFSDTYRRGVVTRLYDLKRELTYMRVAVSPLQDVLAQLLRSQNPLLGEEVRIYLRDVHDHAIRVNDTIDTLREMLGTALSVNLSLVTLAQGEVVKRLAGWAGLLAAPTLIASWYGMNFKHMPELGGRWSYLVLILVTAGVCGVLYTWLKRSKWL